MHDVLLDTSTLNPWLPFSAIARGEALPGVGRTHPGLPCAHRGGQTLRPHIVLWQMSPWMVALLQQVEVKAVK